MALDKWAAVEGGASPMAAPLGQMANERTSASRFTSAIDDQWAKDLVTSRHTVGWKSRISRTASTVARF